MLRRGGETLVSITRAHKKLTTLPVERDGEKTVSLFVDRNPIKREPMKDVYRREGTETRRISPQLSC